jgi:hypothetical protein
MPKQALSDNDGFIGCEKTLDHVAFLVSKLEKADNLKKINTLQEATRDDAIYMVTNKPYSKVPSEDWIMKFDNLIGATKLVDGRMVLLRKGRSGLSHFLSRLKQAIQEEKHFNGQWSMIIMRLERIQQELQGLM